MSLTPPPYLFIRNENIHDYNLKHNKNRKFSQQTEALETSGSTAACFIRQFRHQGVPTDACVISYKLKISGEILDFQLDLQVRAKNLPAEAGRIDGSSNNYSMSGSFKIPSGNSLTPSEIDRSQLQRIHSKFIFS